MRIILKTRAVAVALVLSAVGALGACSTASPGAARGRPRVVVAENFWGSITRQLAGPGADVAQLDPGHRAAYEQRRSAYESTGLRDYNRLLAEIKRRFGGTPIGATESIVAPLAVGAGLEMLTPKSFLDAIAEGNEPTRA